MRYNEPMRPRIELLSWRKVLLSAGIGATGLSLTTLAPIQTSDACGQCFCVPIDPATGVLVIDIDTTATTDLKPVLALSNLSDADRLSLRTVNDGAQHPVEIEVLIADASIVRLVPRGGLSPRTAYELRFDDQRLAEWTTTEGPSGGPDFGTELTLEFDNPATTPICGSLLGAALEVSGLPDEGAGYFVELVVDDEHLIFDDFDLSVEHGGQFGGADDAVEHPQTECLRFRRMAAPRREHRYSTLARVYDRYGNVIELNPGSVELRDIEHFSCGGGPGGCALNGESTPRFGRGGPALGGLASRTRRPR